VRPGDAKRLAELQREYETMARSAAELKQVLRVTVQKEIRSTALATELTEIVKEQKEKISRLTHHYRETSDTKERLLKEVSVLRKDQASKAHAIGRLQAELALCEQKSTHFGKTHKRIEEEYGKNVCQLFQCISFPSSFIVCRCWQSRTIDHL
jgi:chromosome segregation ATPase